MFGAIRPSCMCWITIIFGTLKDGGLKINILALNICFSYRNDFQNFIPILFKFHQHVIQIRIKYYMEKLETLLSALAMLAQMSFDLKVSSKIDFPIGHFMLPFLMLTLDVLCFSIHYLISIWTTF